MLGETATKTPRVVMPSIAILLCTYNGARFLPAQLASLAHQSFTNWRLFVSDDGSSDETLAIVSEYKDRLGTAPVAVRNGPRQGFVKNFLSLACDPSLAFDYYAYCDQDDVWEPDKLARAVERLSSRPAHIPAMYCSRTMLIDERGSNLRLLARLSPQAELPQRAGAEHRQRQHHRVQRSRAPAVDGVWQRAPRFRRTIGGRIC